MSTVSVQNLAYVFEKEKIVRDLSYEFTSRSITGILAPVEERISFLLKMICGIVEPNSGTVTIDGVNIFQENENTVQDTRRKISFCFDRGGLISNLSVLENLLLPYDFHYPGLNRELKQKRIMEVFGRLDIHEEILGERPARLHSQMYKMMILVRTFLLEPSVILYDNPFLDLELHYRKLVYNYLHFLRDEKHTTQIFVSTSDILFEIADEILVFNHGHLVETGSWESLLLNGKETTQRLIKQYLEAGIGAI